MKMREVLNVKEPYLSGGARSAAVDRTRIMVAPVQAPHRIARLGSQGIIPEPDPNHGVTDDSSFALDPPLTSLAPIPTPHTRDLDRIKAQIARLPRHTEQ
jgi:hypothetical protein